MAVSRRRKKGRNTSRRRSGDPRRANLPIQALDYTIPIVSEAFVAARRRVPNAEAILASALPAGVVPGSTLDAIEAGSYLDRVRETLEAQGRALANEYSSVQWLWYTRRISTDFFAGHLVTTQFADHKVLETLTGLSQNPAEEKHDIEGRSVYPTNISDLQPVAHLASIAVALSRCHAWLRRAGKGTEFVVREGDLPEPVEDEALESAIDLYDKRVAADLRWQWHPSMEMNATPDDREDPPSVLMTVSRVLGPWTDIPGWQGPLSERRAVLVKGQFNLNWVTLEGLASSVATAGASTTIWWRPHTPSLAALMFTLWYDATFMSQSLGLSLPAVGYLRRRRGYAVHVIDQMMPLVQADLETFFPGHVPQSGQEVIETLEAVGPELWPPLTGPIVRSLGEDVVLDLWAASSRLIDDIRIPAQLGGPLVNAPARRFEGIVQERVDATAWAPTEKTRGLLRTLRADGVSITDIDAVAEQDGTLLLISCKNIPFTPIYDSGDYRAVRNAATTIDKAYEYWQSVVARLTDSPKGDNYDVSAFRDIAGVVVTPHVLYSRGSGALAERPVGGTHLRGVVSLGELSRALG